MTRAIGYALLLGMLTHRAGAAGLEIGAVERERADLLGLLESETELATKTGMNADFVPGMATILTGADLRLRGVRTVWEALALVPGMTLGLEMTGERLVLSRGVGYGYGSGNIKLLLDGVSMNSSLLATANAVLDIPIEQVERIEVIRGPGSSVHGEYAYAGVVDVITRREGREVHLQAQEGAQAGGGALMSWSDPARELRFSMNLTGLEGDGDGVAMAADASGAPGETNEARRYQAAFTQLRWRDTFVDLKLIEDAYGDYYGINHFLPPDDHTLASRQQAFSAQVGQDLRLAETLRAELRLELLRQQYDRDRLYVFPASYLADEPVYMSRDYQESRYRGAVDVFWKAGARHEWLFAVEASQVEIDQATWDWSDVPFEIPSTWLDTDHERRILGLVIQDQFRPHQDVTLTATLRHDHYSDAGAQLSPRLAAVWRVAEDHILKAQYARAFRPPTFFELEYAVEPQGLDASEITTYELGYILRRPRWEGRLTLFHSDLTDPILFDEVDQAGYVNAPDARLSGAELEYVQRLGTDTKLDANLSYVDATRPSTETVVPGGAALLGNLALLWQPHERWTAVLQARYVGERRRAESEQRSDLDAYGVLDLTLSYRTPVRGLSLYAGVKNLADAEVSYPDLITSFAGADLIYPDGYLRPGRRWWLSLGYVF